MEKATIAKNLTYHRKRQGLSQDGLAQKSTITIRTIQRIENGEVAPHLQTVKLLAAALSIEVDDLIHMNSPKEEDIQKKWLLLLHGTPIFGFVIPLLNVLLPLFLWIHKRGDHRLYDEHGAKVVNFQMTLMILFMLSFVALLTIEKWGFFLFIGIIPFALIITGANMIYAVKLQKCFYPLAFPFIGRKHYGASIPLILCICTFLSCTEPSQPSFERLDGTEIQHDSITRTIERLMDSAKVTGLALSLFQDNEVAYQKTFGFRDKEKGLPLQDTTNMYGASFSKAVFSVLVMKLVEEGLIDLDTPLESYLPQKIYRYEPKTKWHDDFSALKEDSLYHSITARMCLNHTTGFLNFRWLEPDYKLRVHGIPGTKYSYSGEGFIYCQVVLEKLTGKGLQELALEKVFEPLGMAKSGYQWLPEYQANYAFGHDKEERKYKKDTDNEPRGGSTLETTPADYTKFLEAVLQRKILTEASWKVLFTPSIRIKSKAQFGPLAQVETDENEDIQLSYALGWGWLQTPYGYGVFKEGHGNGFQHYSILFPQVGKGIMIMTNSDNGESVFKEILENLMGDNYTPWKWEHYIPYDYKGYLETASGLKYRILREGHGAQAKKGDQVLLRETTAYRNGTVLYSNEASGNPIPITLGAGMATNAVEEGLLNMRAGEVKELVAPPALTKRTIYPRNVSPDSTLVIKLTVDQVIQQ